MKPRVLFVDDEPEVLAAYRRQLHRDFTVDTADGGDTALRMVTEGEPYPVVVADMRMPGMDGSRLLAQVKHTCPSTIRIMLTGHADVETAMLAVNEGHIFRFLTKPCAPDLLIRTLHAALDQFNLVQAEKVLLEKTLRGSVKVLTDTLSLLNPAAFSRGSRIRRLTRDLAEQMGCSAPWQFELAAMLSQIGCVTVPPGVLDKVVAGKTLTPDESRMYAGHPAAGAELIANIPRLELVARMIALQQTPFHSFPRAANDEDETVAMGAQLLKVCLDLDALEQRNHTAPRAIEIMQRKEGLYHPKILEALRIRLTYGEEARNIKEILWHQARTDMVAAQNVMARNGVLLVPKDSEFTVQALARLKNFAAEGGIQEPFLVYVKPAHQGHAFEGTVSPTEGPSHHVAPSQT